MSPVHCVPNDFSSYCVFLFDLIELVSFDELDLFDDKSDNDGSRSGSPGTCDFPFCSDESVGSVGESFSRFRGMRPDIFFQKEFSQLMTLFCWLCLYQK